MRTTISAATGENDREHGTALVLTLLATTLLSALGAAMIASANMETSIGSTFREDRELVYAAEAVVARAVHDVRLSSRWDDILTGAQLSSFLDPMTVPWLPSGGTLDVPAATRRLQSATNTIFAGANAPQWRVFASGRLADVAGQGALESRAYLVAWVADDPSETDGNPFADTNDTLVVRGEAVGSGGRTRALEVTVTRAGVPRGQAGLSITSWREVR
jgi:hypothetical protein